MTKHEPCVAVHGGAPLVSDSESQSRAAQVISPGSAKRRLGKRRMGSTGAASQTAPHPLAFNGPLA